MHIITDTSTLYTPKEAEERGFVSVPLCVTIGDFDGRDLAVDMDMFYGKIAEGLHPASSQPPIGDVYDAFQAHLDDEIINISMADGLSGTYQTACSARSMTDQPEKIHVVNTKTLCGPHRYMVERAIEMKKEGKSVAEIVAWLEDTANHTESFLIPQDFSFLRRGGRMTPAAAAVGHLLKLKPIVKLTADGKRLDKFKIKRTMSSAVKSILEYLKEKELGKDHILYIVHARALDDVEKIKALFAESFPELECRVHELSPVFVTQGGPQCVAIQYVRR